MISVNDGVSCKKEEDSQASTRHVTFHLPFGYVFDRYSVFKVVSPKYYPLQRLRHKNMIPGVNIPQ